MTPPYARPQALPDSPEATARSIEGPLRRHRRRTEKARLLPGRMARKCHARDCAGAVWRWPVVAGDAQFGRIAGARGGRRGGGVRGELARYAATGAGRGHRRDDRGTVAHARGEANRYGRIGGHLASNDAMAG